jgi:hypothetical protein
MVEDKFVVNSDQIKECIYCFFDKHVSFRRTRKVWLAGNQDNVSRTVVSRC